MKTIRAFAILTLGLLGAYHVLRVIAAQCSGVQCDGLVPLSLALPLLILVMVSVTGLMSVAAAKRRASAAQDRVIKNKQIGWVGLLAALSVVGVLGPVVSLAIFRDNPDLFVPISTVLAAFLPVSALVYSFAHPKVVSPSPPLMGYLRPRDGRR